MAIDPDLLNAANGKSRKLRELVRAPEILIMPGAYDVLSALLFEKWASKRSKAPAAASPWFWVTRTVKL